MDGWMDGVSPRQRQMGRRDPMNLGDSVTPLLRLPVRRSSTEVAADRFGLASAGENVRTRRLAAGTGRGCHEGGPHATLASSQIHALRIRETLVDIGLPPIRSLRVKREKPWIASD